jgi:hypothetical protein
MLILVQFTTIIFLGIPCGDYSYFVEIVNRALIFICLITKRVIPKTLIFIKKRQLNIFFSNKQVTCTVKE